MIMRENGVDKNPQNPLIVELPKHPSALRSNSSPYHHFVTLLPADSVETMANDDSDNLTDSEQQPEEDEEEVEEYPSQGQEDEDENEDEEEKLSSSSSDRNSDSDYGSDYDSYESDVDYPSVQDDSLPATARRRSPDMDNTAENNIRRFSEVMDSPSVKQMQEDADRKYLSEDEEFDFPKDPENWREEDLRELWADPPLEATKTGWDPAWAEKEDWDYVNKEIREGRDPAIAPFYIPYRKPYPPIPDNHRDISTPKAVVEELDRIEEFLTWVSYIFPDGSSYEGTVWDDLAHGKGVYVAEMGLVRYEGEWLRNEEEGHGVVEVDIPDIEPLPGSELEKKMRAEGHVFERDFMSPEDREWLEMDIEDSVRLAGDAYEIPFYERDEWVKEYGRKPEKGRYRYAGQWKHGRMHGCGIYEVNERPIHGRFYFGELMDEDHGCDEDISTLHAGIAEVAAAKARMFVNKPDGMIREERGPYSDPQHPYFYDEDDVWMAPGFINQFYEVPDYWKTYAHDVDEEREMWLNSFYKAPLRLPMPAELEYWWENDEEPEFVLLNKEPEPDPEDPSKLVYTEEPVILHTKTGHIIDYVDDEEHGIRLFWQPSLKEGEEMDMDKVEFLPLGFDEFYGRGPVEKKENIWTRLITSVENTCNPMFEKLDKWVEEKKKDSEMKIKLYEKERELAEAELRLEEAIEEMDEELEMLEEEEENKEEEAATEIGSKGDVDISASVKNDFSESLKNDMSASLKSDEKSLPQEGDDEEEEEEGDDEDDDFGEPSSFGSVATDKDEEKNRREGNKPENSSFSAISLAFSSCSLVSAVPRLFQQSIVSWKHRPEPASRSHNVEFSAVSLKAFGLPSQKGRLRAELAANAKFQTRRQQSQLHSLFRSLSHCESRKKRENFTRNKLDLKGVGTDKCLDSILCLQMDATAWYDIKLPLQHPFP